MEEHLSRRKFIKLAAAVSGATISGFDLRARSWVTQAQAQTPSFQSVPKLDGALVFDEASRQAIAVDRGNLFHRIPAAVLRPDSVQDILTMVQYANQHTLKIAIKGQGHSPYGQTQAETGIVIDSSTFSAVHTPTTESVDAQCGALWGDVATATLSKGLTPRVLPATCMALTVGGTLSVGGHGSTSHLYGAQVDNVTGLDVVTGDGRLVTCSPAHESELFHMVLAGLGQCGIIVRARIPLIPAPSHVLLHTLRYTDLDHYLSDQLRLAAAGRFNNQRGLMSRTREGQWSFTIEVGQFFSPPTEPNLATLEADLHFDSATPPVSMTYQEYLYRFEARNATQPVNRPSPYLTLYIPASATKAYLSHILALSPERARLPQTNGVETFGCHPLNTRRFTCPLFKVPAEEQAFSVWLFRSVDPGDEAGLSAVLASNRMQVPFTQPMSHYPQSQFLAAEMEVGLRAARALVIQTASALSEPAVRVAPPLMDIIACHQFGLETAAGVVEKAMRLVGGAALFRSSPLEQMYRDTRAAVLHQPFGGYDGRGWLGKLVFGIAPDTMPRWV